ncbi:hypothetical protein [Aphanothece sacrum]|uniref:Septum site-determining protein MinC n=1 Tax=Aphanothece sacrum FPU1 TaxID=1920663 RepID=A0A401IK47_APHSA|nr:hypothetical protein [Aphanothece sacrum]GBF81672.1 septum site-determining protein MinC [Aphanothece sacrum FPU1]GBF84069.1 septum formation inhibitor MinC [Aphanothece sacrum FPU3]
MDKFTEITTSISPEITTKTNDVPWWNRPVVGEKSILKDLLGKLSKTEVSESALVLHNREMNDLRVFAKTAQAIDNEKFGKEEFLIFVKIKYMLVKNVDKYKGIYDSLRLLQVAIEAKDSFISIDQTELRYRGSKQQEFYDFVQELLEDHENTATFRQQTQEKLIELLPQVKTDEGKIALQSYAKHLDKLSEHELGLKLLCLFKAYQLADYSILRVISEMIQNLGKSDLQDFRSLVALVMVNYSVFEKLRGIIGLSHSQSNPETYTRMIQYIALSNRYSISYIKFDELMKVMRKWFRPYYAIMGIRQEHPPTEYKQPKEFGEAIPGEEIYEKYRKWLKNKKTGMTYVDFGDET